MSLPYMPFFVDDYEANTAHLTLEEDGVYNRLLRLCWRTPGCSIPHDDKWIRRMMRVDETTYSNVVLPIIIEFFKVDKARLFSPRLMREFLIAKDKHEKRVEAGRKGGRIAKSLKSKETDGSNAKAMLKQNGKQNGSNHNHNHNHSKKVIVEETITQKKRGSRLSADWFPEPLDQAFMDKHNLTPDILQNQFESFQDYWLSLPGAKANKTDWQATWRNWLRNRRQPYSKPNGKSTRAEIKKALWEAATGRKANEEYEPEKTIRPAIAVIPSSK